MSTLIKMLIMMMIIFFFCDFGFQVIPLTLSLHYLFFTNNYRLARVHRNMDN